MPPFPRFFCTALCLALALAGTLPGIAQQSATPSSAAQPVADSIPAAREKLRTAEAAHPGKTPEVADAIHALLSLIIDSGTVDKGTLDLILREVDLRASLTGTRSAEYLAALDFQIDILLALNRAADARAIAEQALDIAQSALPGTDQTSVAAGTLAQVCSSLGDTTCAIRAQQASVDNARKLSAGKDSPQLAASLANLGTLKGRAGDVQGAILAHEEALAISYRLDPTDNHTGVIENNLGSNYLKIPDFQKAELHLRRAVDMLGKLYGADSPRLMQISKNLAALYTRTGNFPLAWKTYEFSLRNTFEQLDAQATNHFMFSQSLAQGGDSQRAIAEGLTSARMSREIFVLQARTLPERQALAYDAIRARGLDTSLSVLLRHRDLPASDIYQEAIRSRALVTEEMARRQKNLNADNNSEVAELLASLDNQRSALLALEQSPKADKSKAVEAATAQMEKTERALAELSIPLRDDSRTAAVSLQDIRHNLPPHSALVSYLSYRRITVEKVDPNHTLTPAYMAFVLSADSDAIHIYDLGDAKPIEDLVASLRATADTEAHSAGMGAVRNERAYRMAGESLRKLIWDPLAQQLTASQLALVVPDGVLNLIPFSGLPDVPGYLVEHGPVIHMLTSERDLVPTAPAPKKTGLLAVGSPSFQLAANQLPPAPLRDATSSCEQFSSFAFQPLPGTAEEVRNVASSWQRWNASEPTQLLTGDNATLAGFLLNAPHSRVLHVATHAFLLNKDCGGPNPLLHSGLVFAGGRDGGAQSILTAQQIASIDLSGVEWAVLSACNTGNGVLHDGEGVLGLERAFRLAGARTVIVTLWPVDDNLTQRFMRLLYTQRLSRHATTADALWSAERVLLHQRRAAGLSTHPWYWAGFVGAGSWQ